MFRILLAILLTVSSPAWAITQWNKAKPASGDNLTSWPTDNQANLSVLDTVLSNYRRGMALIYKSATALTVTSGECVVSISGGATRLFLQLSSNTDVTTANLDTGASFSATTTYYIYAGTSSTTASSPTLYVSLSSSAPTGITYYLQLGSFTTDGSGNIISSQIYDIPNGNAKADVLGKSGIQAVYDYGTSSSASTLHTGGMLVAFGNVSVANKSSTTISGLPYSSSTSYKCTCNQVAGTLALMTGPCAISYSSGTQVLIENAADTTFNSSWQCIGY